MPDRTDTRSPDEIRRSIARTRSQLDETVDTLEDRLAPKKLMNEAWDRIRDRTDDLGTRIGSSAKEHPVPLALIGVGLGWLLVDEIRGRSSSHEGQHELGPGTEEPAEGRRGPYGPDAVNRDDPEWAHASRTARLKAKARGVRYRAGTAARGAKDVQGRVSRFIDDNPLAVGAIAFGLGLASAMSVRSSETESRVAGRASDRVKRQARRMGREMKDEARSELDDMGREAGERAARVAEDAARAAREDVRREEAESRREQPRPGRA